MFRNKGTASVGFQYTCAGEFCSIISRKQYECPQILEFSPDLVQMLVFGAESVNKSLLVDGLPCLENRSEVF